MADSQGTNVPNNPFGHDIARHAKLGGEHTHKAGCFAIAAVAFAEDTALFRAPVFNRKGDTVDITEAYRPSDILTAPLMNMDGKPDTRGNTARLDYLVSELCGVDLKALAPHRRKSLTDKVMAGLRIVLELTSRGYAFKVSTDRKEALAFGWREGKLYLPAECFVDPPKADADENAQEEYKAIIGKGRVCTDEHKYRIADALRLLFPRAKREINTEVSEEATQVAFNKTVSGITESIRGYLDPDYETAAPVFAFNGLTIASLSTLHGEIERLLRVEASEDV